MLSLSHGNQSNIIETFNSTSRYLDDLLNINIDYFEEMVDKIYPKDIQLNQSNNSDTEALSLDLKLPISKDIISIIIISNGTTFILILYNFHFRMAMSLVLHHMVYKFLS